MCFNERIIRTVSIMRGNCKKRSIYTQILGEKQPLLPLLQNGCKYGISIANGEIVLTRPENGVLTDVSDEEIEESTEIWKWPSEKSKVQVFWWLITWPISFLFNMTIPNCRKSPKLFPLTFIMCISWIAGTSYIIAWIITIIGEWCWLFRNILQEGKTEPFTLYEVTWNIFCGRYFVLFYPEFFPSYTLSNNLSNHQNREVC